MEKRKCKGGGALAAGLIMFFASPEMDGKKNNPSAFAYESDRWGGLIRFPGEERPLTNDAIMASNHFLKYGSENELCDPAIPNVFKIPV